MCGIAGGVGLGTEGERRVEAALVATAHRGPDARMFVEDGDVILGHNRLAILDLDPRSDQPFVRNDLVLAYNGELWNYRELRDQLRALGATFRTEGDTEVVAAALELWGEAALSRMNGMWAMAWTHDGRTVSLARDRYGEIPLHFDSASGTFCSELKGLLALGARAWQDVLPGEVVELRAGAGPVRRRWYDAPTAARRARREDAAEEILRLLDEGAAARAISDVPVCTLLSGGLDSALIAWALKKRIPELVAYVAVLDPKAPDVRMARFAAEVIGVELREVRVEAPSAVDLAGVVRLVEMPFKAQVEIGWACVALAERMRADGFKVTFSGEGSDELWASYGFADHALRTEDWHQYRKRLFLDQHRKNFARCNKVFMSRSVECRLPFLHPPLVEYALSLTRDVVQSGQNPSGRKAVLKEAAAPVLPERIWRRAKVAFQDGMGLKRAIENTIADPRRFYELAFRRAFSAP